MFLVNHWNGLEYSEKEVTPLFVTADERVAKKFVELSNNREKLIAEELVMIFDILGERPYHNRQRYYQLKYYDQFGITMGGEFSYYAIPEYNSLSEISTKVI